MQLSIQDHLPQLQSIVRAALAEDIGAGDLTTLSIVPPEKQQTGRLVAKQAGVIAGLEVVALTFAALDKPVRFQAHVADGQRVTAGTLIGSFEGSSQTLLMGERV